MMPVTKVIYSSLDYDRDVKRFEETENGKNRLDLAGFKRLMIHDLCANTDVLKSHKIKGYSLERITDALENPTSNPIMLIEISHYLYNTSQFYMRLNNYFAKMGLFNYNIDVYDVKESELDSEEKQMKLRDAYANVCSEFEKIGFKHEMSKIMSVLPMQDVFYGLIFEDSSDFFILSINPSLCKICQVQDGVFNFKMRLSGINPLHIGSYPDCVKQAYLDYRNAEIEILANYMVIAYLDSNYIRVPLALKQTLSSKDFNAFSPANQLEKMVAMREMYRKDNETLLSRYRWIKQDM